MGSGNPTRGAEAPQVIPFLCAVTSRVLELTRFQCRGGAMPMLCQWSAFLSVCIWFVALARPRLVPRRPGSCQSVGWRTPGFRLLGDGICPLMAPQQLRARVQTCPGFILASSLLVPFPAAAWVRVGVYPLCQRSLSGCLIQGGLSPPSGSVSPRSLRRDRNRKVSQILGNHNRLLQPPDSKGLSAPLVGA